MLHALLDAVIDGQTDNRRDTLLRLARTEWRNNMSNKEIFIETYNKTSIVRAQKSCLRGSRARISSRLPRPRSFHATYEGGLLDHCSTCTTC